MNPLKRLLSCHHLRPLASTTMFARSLRQLGWKFVQLQVEVKCWKKSVAVVHQNRLRVQLLFEKCLFMLVLCLISGWCESWAESHKRWCCSCQAVAGYVVCRSLCPVFLFILFQEEVIKSYLEAPDDDEDLDGVETHEIGEEEEAEVDAPIEEWTGGPTFTKTTFAWFVKFVWISTWTWIQKFITLHFFIARSLSGAAILTVGGCTGSTAFQNELLHTSKNITMIGCIPQKELAVGFHNHSGSPKGFTGIWTTLGAWDQGFHSQKERVDLGLLYCELVSRRAGLNWNHTHHFFVVRVRVINSKATMTWKIKNTWRATCTPYMFISFMLYKKYQFLYLWKKWLRVDRLVQCLLVWQHWLNACFCDNIWLNTCFCDIGSMLVAVATLAQCLLLWRHLAQWSQCNNAVCCITWHAKTQNPGCLARAKTKGTIHRFNPFLHIPEALLCWGRDWWCRQTRGQLLPRVMDLQEIHSCCGMLGNLGLTQGQSLGRGHRGGFRHGCFWCGSFVFREHNFSMRHLNDGCRWRFNWNHKPHGTLPRAWHHWLKWTCSPFDLVQSFADGNAITAVREGSTQPLRLLSLRKEHGARAH